MAPETVDRAVDRGPGVLRCESHRPRPEPRWGLIAAVVVLMASTLDALWLVPAQRAAEQERDRFGIRYRCVDTPAPAPAPPPAATAEPAPRSRTANVKVEGVYLMRPPAR